MSCLRPPTAQHIGPRARAPHRTTPPSPTTHAGSACPSDCKACPWCEQCGTTSSLTVDHILPVSDYAEIAYATENLTVRCRSCNSRRGTRYTLDEAQAVLTRLQRAYERRPTRQGAERVQAAQRAVQASR